MTATRLRLPELLSGPALVLISKDVLGFEFNGRTLTYYIVFFGAAAMILLLLRISRIRLSAADVPVGCARERLGFEPKPRLSHRVSSDMGHVIAPCLSWLRLRVCWACTLWLRYA